MPVFKDSSYAAWNKSPWPPVHTCHTGQSIRMCTLSDTITGTAHTRISVITLTQRKSNSECGCSIRGSFSIGRWPITGTHYRTPCPGHQALEGPDSDHTFTDLPGLNLTNSVREGLCHFKVKFLEPCRSHMRCKDSECQWLDTGALWSLGVKLKAAMNVK